MQWIQKDPVQHLSGEVTPMASQAGGATARALVESWQLSHSSMHIAPDGQFKTTT